MRTTRTVEGICKSEWPAIAAELGIPEAEIIVSKHMTSPAVVLKAWLGAAVVEAAIHFGRLGGGFDDPEQAHEIAVLCDEMHTLGCALVEMLGAATPPAPAFAVGDRVRMTHEPYRDGTVVEAHPNKHLVTVRWDGFGQDLRLLSELVTRLNPAPQPAPVVDGCTWCGTDQCRCSIERAAAEAQRAEAPPPPIPDYPHRCPCGAPCVELLVGRICSRDGCTGRVPEVEIVVWAGIAKHEPCWWAAARVATFGALPAATREAAIAAVRRRLEER